MCKKWGENISAEVINEKEIHNLQTLLRTLPLFKEGSCMAGHQVSKETAATLWTVHSDVVR